MAYAASNLLMQSSDVTTAERLAPARAEALRRLADFLPRAGRTYAAERNYDRGQTDRSNVSTLSLYLRHRVITETEVLRAVLARHSPSAAQKFVQEVFWRTYWKGWLQAHPAAWTRYRATLAIQLEQVAAASPQQRMYDQAVIGRTGIDAFDAWLRELIDTHYLHNHARMWFASIWIFTLELPWELGADLFMRNLLDGDPASNTLSWRWVAGLHTRGRVYTASADNIRRYTAERFASTTGLARSPVALDDALLPIVSTPSAVVTPLDSQPTLFIVHDDDLHGDLAELPPNVRGVAGLCAVAGRSSRPVSAAVRMFATDSSVQSITAIAQALDAADFGVLDSTGAQSAATAITTAAAACGATRIVLPLAPIGPVRELLDALRPLLSACGLTYYESSRRYDAVAWPAATRGFFMLRSRIPAILAELGIGAG